MISVPGTPAKPTTPAPDPTFLAMATAMEAQRQQSILGSPTAVPKPAKGK